MAKFRQVTHVIFDMDGVLLDTEPLYTKAIQNVVSKYGKQFTWELKTRLMGLHREEAAKFIIKELELPLTWKQYACMVQSQYKNVFANTEFFPDSEGVYKNAIALIAKKFGKKYTPDIMEKIKGTTQQDTVRIAVTEMKLPISTDEFRTEFRTLAYSNFAKYAVPFLPGAQTLVHHLSKHKIPMSVATSSSESSYEIKTAKHKDFFKLFDHIICGGSDPDVKKGKPSPDIFLASASRFPSKPKPEKCLVMEDAPNGVQAAINAGMQVIMIPDENISAELRKDATLVIDSLNSVPLEKFGLPPMK